MPVDTCPEVKARAIRRSDGIWDLFIRCPFCGKEHHHGGGDGDTPDYGYRAAHCTGTRREYLSYKIVPICHKP